MNYPLSENNYDIKSKSGKTLNDITVDEVMKGNITGEDIKISKEALKLQGQVAKENGRTQLGDNLERASELVDIPDEEILNIYNMLRPNRSTAEELLNKAKEIRQKYGALRCSYLLEDAARVYEKRGILK